MGEAVRKRHSNSRMAKYPTNLRTVPWARPAKNVKVFIERRVSRSAGRQVSSPKTQIAPFPVNWDCMIPTLTWTPEGVRFIDQTKLPLEESYVVATSYEQVADVIVTMVVRGAPAIGVSGRLVDRAGRGEDEGEDCRRVCRRVQDDLRSAGGHAAYGGQPLLGDRPDEEVFSGFVPETPIAIVARERFLPRRMPCMTKTSPHARRWAISAVQLLPDEGGVLTHCNAGALATCGYGTALGVIRSAVEQGKNIHVYADETRPFLQGARLTAWELMADGIPTTVICDNMAASLMRAGKIGAVVVGADRIAANGDFANKIGTYNVAILAKEHAFRSIALRRGRRSISIRRMGDAIPIEERSAKEVTHHGGKQLTPHNVGICNPAFDVTPAKYVTAIITERGVLRAPYSESLSEMSLAAWQVESLIRVEVW